MTNADFHNETGHHGRGSTEDEHDQSQSRSPATTADEARRVPELDAPHSQTALRHRTIKRILWAILGLNLGVALIKALAGAASGSTALLADALHSSFDGVGNVVGLVAIGIASRPPDDDHPYGHHKSEVLAAAAIGLLILFGGLEVARSGWTAYTEGARPETSVWAFLAAGFSLVVSIGVSIWERRAGDRLDSPVLQADAGHTASDALATGAVLGGLALVHIGVGWGDLLATGVVLALLFRTAWQLFVSAASVVMDESRIPATGVCEIAAAVPGLLSCHAVRSRGMPGHVSLDLHVTFDPTMTLHEAGERMLELKRLLRDAFPELKDIVIQLEPHLPKHLEGRWSSASPVDPRHRH